MKVILPPGGAINIVNVDSYVDTCQFINNTADYGGAFYMNGDFKILNSEFKYNSAQFGGALYVYDGRVSSSIGTSNFTSNKVDKEGGAIHCDGYNYNQLYTGVQLYISGGGTSTLNSATSGNGGFAYLSNCVLKIENKYMVSNNTASSGGAILCT